MGDRVHTDSTSIHGPKMAESKFIFGRKLFELRKAPIVEAVNNFDMKVTHDMDVSKKRGTPNHAF